MKQKKERSLLGLFIGKLIKKGNRSLAEREVLKCIEGLEKEHKGLETLIEAVENVAPLVQIKSKKVGGTAYRIPIGISDARANAVGIGWILDGVKKGKGGDVSNRISRELLAAKEGRGRAMEQQKELHELARKNRGLVKFL
jgi:small subunit ribosomal protein S7